MKMKFATFLTTFSVNHQYTIASELDLAGIVQNLQKEQPVLFKEAKMIYPRKLPLGIEVRELYILEKIFQLQLPQNTSSCILHEAIFDLYLDRGLKSLILQSPTPQDQLFKCLYKVYFKKYDLTLAEIQSLEDDLPSDDAESELELRHASTNPLISDFDREISSNPKYNMRVIRKNLAKEFESVVKALTKDRSHAIIAISLQSRLCSWMIDFPPLTNGNIELANLLCGFSRLCPLAPEQAIRIKMRVLKIFDQLRDYFPPLLELPKVAAARRKLALMINFPQHARLTCENSTAQILKIIFSEDKLSACRWLIAKGLNWDHDIVGDAFYYVQFDSQGDYYDGFQENLKFDGLIDHIKRHKDRLCEFFAEEPPWKLLNEYDEVTMWEEKQGTVYATLREQYNLVGEINPLNDEIDVNFENQIIMRLTQEYRPFKFLLGLKYLEIAKIPISRLLFNPRNDMSKFLLNLFNNDSLNAMKKLQDIYYQIAKDCLKSYQSSVRISVHLDPSNTNLLDWLEITLNELAAICPLRVCIPNILERLNADCDTVTQKLLLTILSKIVSQHFPTEASSINLAIFSRELEVRLLELLKNG